MKITILSVGKKNEIKYEAAVDDFTRRAKHYFDVAWKIIPASKSTTAPVADQKNEEGKALLNGIQADDFLILLDERGNTLTTDVFADLLQKHLSRSTKHIVFIIGGAFGVSDAVWSRANFSIAFGKMVFPHQIVRLLVVEQIYRAGTLLKGEKYHHK